MSRQNENIEPHARLIAGLAETMRDGMWASDLLTRCEQITRAAQEIAAIARARAGGER